MILLEFKNSNEKELFVQVDPWACIYKITKGCSLKLVIKNKSEDQSFTIDDCDSRTKILTLWDSEEFFIQDGDRLLHWEQFQSNS